MTALISICDLPNVPVAYVMNEAGQCPRCRMQNERDGHALNERERRRKQLWDELDALLDGGRSNDD